MAMQNSHTNHRFSHLRNTTQHREAVFLLAVRYVFFPHSFVHPNASLLCILHSLFILPYLLFFCICCSALSPFLMNFSHSESATLHEVRKEYFNKPILHSCPRYALKFCKEPVHKPSEFKITFSDSSVLQWKSIICCLVSLPGCLGFQRQSPRLIFTGATLRPRQVKQPPACPVPDPSMICSNDLSGKQTAYHHTVKYPGGLSL